MQKHIAMNMVRDHQQAMIKQAKEMEDEILKMAGAREQLRKEIRSMTALIEKLDELPNHPKEK